MKSYENYFPILSKIEKRLFEQGYWKVGLTDNDKIRGGIPIVQETQKWVDMMKVLLHETPRNVIISEEKIIQYMNNPNTEKNRKIIKKVNTSKWI